MKCTFSVGDKVTPVARHGWITRIGGKNGSVVQGSKFGYFEPLFGEIYTVREVYIDYYNEIAIRLIEAVNPGDLGYVAINFRRAYDLSAFNKALKAQPVKPKEKEDVVST